jgi:invasion protein IalB
MAKIVKKIMNERILAAGLGLALAAVAASGASAQQQKAPQAAPAPAQKAPAAAAPAAAQKAPAAAGAPQSAWVKLCEKAPFAGKDKDGKEIRTEKSICLTHHERIDGNSGMVLVSAAIRQIEGEPKSHLMVMVPLGMALAPGMQIGVYPKDMWDKVQKGEKVDDSKLKPVKLAYALCHAAGCTAEAEATAEMLTEIKGGAGLIVYALNGNGAPVAFPVPLNGFDVALNGKPVDNAEYSKARQQLMQQIAQRQKEAFEQYKKQNEELQKMQGNQAQGIAPAAKGPAPAAPATGSTQKK